MPEGNENGELPALKALKTDWSDYDVIFLGYPIWFGTYALPMGSLVKQTDFAGKRLSPSVPLEAVA